MIGKWLAIFFRYSWVTSLVELRVEDYPTLGISVKILIWSLFLHNMCKKVFKISCIREIHSVVQKGHVVNGTTQFSLPEIRSTLVCVIETRPMCWSVVRNETRERSSPIKCLYGCLYNRISDPRTAHMCYLYHIYIITLICVLKLIFNPKTQH